MSREFLRFLLRFSVIMIGFSEVNAALNLTRQNFLLLIDFACAVAKDELEKHPEMRTIAMVDHENKFPFDFSREVLKCLPRDVTKIIFNPHSEYKNSTVKLPKQTMVIYVADKVEQNQAFRQGEILRRNFPVVNHLSKLMILSSEKTRIENFPEAFGVLNVVQVYQENRKVIARSFDRTKNLTVQEHENLSQILFPDKNKKLNLQGQKLYAVYTPQVESIVINGSDRPVNKWTHYLDIVAEKLNATITYILMPIDRTNWRKYKKSQGIGIRGLTQKGQLDFYLNFLYYKFDLESYDFQQFCYMVPLPDPIPIYELILFLPMDKSCWMWLMITIAVSTFVWRISEGHWDFPFGSFSYFMGQAQLVVRIRTNRLTMKILLQLLIFAIFIFSNGYQSIVTSFMLNPMQQKLLKTVDEVFDSEFKMEFNLYVENIHMDNPKYQKAYREGRIGFFSTADSTIEIFREIRAAVLAPCQGIKNQVKYEGDGKSVGGFYLVPEVISSQEQDLFTRPFHPYIEKFQEIMDQSFEAGLSQAWERFYWEAYVELYLNRTQPEEAETDLLDFSMIAPFFLILVVGFISGLLALLCEVFWHDFVMELTGDYFKRKFEEIFRRRLNRVRVGRIQVQPAPRSIQIEPMREQN